MRNSLVRSLRRVLLPPESPQELFLRTLYHRLNATPFFVRRQIKRAEASYHGWRSQSNAQLPPVTSRSAPQPKVVFLLSIDQGEERDAFETIDSFSALHGGDWQVLPIVSGSVKLEDYLSRVAADERFQPPRGLTGLSLAGTPTSSADFVVFCRAGDVFDPTLLERFQAALEDYPQAAVYYTDCEFLQADSTTPAPFFKPAARSPELMLSFNYLSRAFVHTTAFSNLAINLEKCSNLQELEYAILLALLAQPVPTQQIPAVLVKLSSAPPPVPDRRAEIVTTHFKDAGLREVSVTSGGASLHVSWDFGNPSVSLIILNRDHAEWIRNLIESIFNLTDYPHFSLIVVDNQSSQADVLDYYRELSGDTRVQVVHYDRPFNYSEAINTGVAHSTAEVVVLLNNDMRVTDAGWLRELVQWVMHPGIGVVGGKLLHRDRSIQHAGIILGMNGFIGHLYLNAPEHYHGLAGSVDWYRNFYALTGACQAIRRELFHRVGGYDERFRLAFGDIDFCLRVVNAGFRNLYNPFAVLTHFEGGSRGYETPVQDILLGYDELLPWLERDDPYFSPNLTYEPIPACALSKDGVNVRLENIQRRKEALSAQR